MSKITQAIKAANGEGRLALAAFATAGFPSKEEFRRILPEIAVRCDVLEIGVPFSDPMADGVSIQDASFQALKQGVTLQWIFDTVEALKTDTPVVLMSYLNPLLAYGMDRLAESARGQGVSGFIVPDLPLEESNILTETLHPAGQDLIQLVTPATPDDRMQRLCEASRGFIYAVTNTGTTGGNARANTGLANYLDRIRKHATKPVMAGFGIREPAHVRAIAGHAEGVVVGSAIVEALATGKDVLKLIEQLKSATRVDAEVSL